MSIDVFMNVLFKGKLSLIRFLLFNVIIFLILVAWSVFLKPIEGKYSGPLLNVFGGGTKLVLSNGIAYLKLNESDTTLFQFGEYKEEGDTFILMSAGNQKWIIQKGLFGFEMIDATNKTNHYKFLRSWLCPDILD